MAHLSIEQATIGYDVTGLQQCINKLNMVVFQGAIDVIHTSIPEIRDAVDTCWQGRSADAFKGKLERDSQVMIDTLGELKEKVEGQFAQMAKNVDNFDTAIAESINNM